MPEYQITKPTLYPVSLAEQKLHSRVDSNADDDLITSLIIANTEKLERELRRSFLEQEWRLELSSFTKPNNDDNDVIYYTNYDAMKLPFSPLVSIDSVKYYDSSNVLQTISSSNYFVSGGEIPRLNFDSNFSIPSIYSRPDAIQINYTTGDTVEDVPEVFKTIIKIMVSTDYRNRELTKTEEDSMNRIKDNYKIMWTY